VEREKEEGLFEGPEDPGAEEEEVAWIGMLLAACIIELELYKTYLPCYPDALAHRRLSRL
jgi:hypothetical protein